MWLRCGAMTSTVPLRPISRNSASPVASNCRMAEPNWKPWVHSVQPRLVYLPPKVKTGAPLAGTQDCSMERILAAERANRRRSLGASPLRAGADCVSTIPRNFSLSVVFARIANAAWVRDTEVDEREAPIRAATGVPSGPGSALEYVL